VRAEARAVKQILFISPPGDFAESKVKSQGELYLAVCAEADGALNR